MKARPLRMRGDEYEICSPSDAKFLEIHIPGKNVRRVIPITTHDLAEEEVGPVWVWNGDTEKPTLTPDIDTRTAKTGRCRCKILEGMVEFHIDSEHEYAGEKMNLLEVAKALDAESLPKDQ